MGLPARISSCIAVAVLQLVLSTPVLAAPATDLDRAKKVYGEAMAALDAKDYTTATSKFEEAYRLAPDKHLFNYNIASAAELAGDCRKAQKHYKMFLDLVPKHEARKGAERTVKKLETSCAHDDETTQQLSIEARGDREAERSKAGAERALDEALEATRQSIARYEAVVTKHGRQQPFARILRAKRRDAKKIVKVMVAHELEPQEYREEVPAPATVEQACRQGEAQEERNANAYNKAYDRFEDADVVVLMDKLIRRAEDRHARAFRDACPRR